MGSFKDAWALVQTIATITKDLERATSEIGDLRKDLNSLTLAVTQLTSELQNQTERTAMVLDGYEKDLSHAKETLAVKFEILTAKLEQALLKFEMDMSSPKLSTRKRKALGPEKNNEKK